MNQLSQLARLGTVGTLILAAAGCADAPATGEDVSEARQNLSTCVTIQRGTLGSVIDTVIAPSVTTPGWMGTADTLRAGGTFESLLKFDLSSIPSNASINSATLTLYTSSTVSNAFLFARYAKVPWSESTSTFAGFNQQVAKEIMGVMTPSSVNTFQSMTLKTPIVQAWVNGSLANDGLVLETMITNSYNAWKDTIFVSSDAATVAQRPALKVCYTPVDYCASSPCQNGATCQSGQSGYTCACAPGFTGQNCQTNIDDCAGNPCQNGGACTDGVNGYTCSCAPGYTGANCQTDIDECAGSPCQNGGTCTDHVNAYSCACPPGFSGTNCEINIDECAGNPCQNGGYCTDGVNGYTCSCAAGFTGSNCQTNVDDCVGNGCQNGAACVDGVNGYTCVCPTGYSGPLCATNIDECAGNPCQNGGSCIDGVNSYTCQCAPGFTGSNCQTDINDCATNPCLNGGACVDGVNSYTCQCAAGWSGTNCDTPTTATCPCMDQEPDLWQEIATLPPDTAECATGNIHNTLGPFAYGGPAGGGQYGCFLGSPFTNRSISLTISAADAAVCAARIATACFDNSCASNPCPTGETCVPGQYTSYGYTCGDACATNPCASGQTCTATGPSSYTCTCPVGTAGANCEVSCPCVTTSDTDTSGPWTAARDGAVTAEACQADGAGFTLLSTGGNYSDMLVLTPTYCRAMVAAKPGGLFPTTATENAACQTIVDHAKTAAGLTCDAADTCPCAGYGDWVPGVNHACAFGPRSDVPENALSHLSVSPQDNSLTNGEGPAVWYLSTAPDDAICYELTNSVYATLSRTGYEACFASLLSVDNGACTPCEQGLCGYSSIECLAYVYSGTFCN